MEDQTSFMLENLPPTRETMKMRSTDDKTELCALIERLTEKLLWLIVVKKATACVIHLENDLGWISKYQGIPSD